MTDCSSSTVQTLEALQGLIASVDFISLVGEARANQLKARALSCVQLLSNSSIPINESGVLVGDLAWDCVELVSAGDATWTESEDNGDDMTVWGFGAPLAEVMACGLAAVANLLPPAGDSFDAEGCEHTRQLVLSVVRDVAFDLDCLSVHIFGSLGRPHEESSSAALRGDRGGTRLERGLRAICTWLFIALGRAAGYGAITREVLWEVAHGDALWALLLTKGVLSSAPEPPAGPQVPAPPDLPALRGAMLKAALELVAPPMAFLREDSTRECNDLPIQIRGVCIARHRARLARAAAQCAFFHTVLQEEVLWPEVAAFAAAVVRPVRVGFGDNPADWPAASVLGTEEETLDGTATQEGACSQSALLIRQLLRQREALWTLLAETACSIDDARLNAFLENCATVAHGIPPRASHCETFIGQCLARRDAGMLKLGSLAAVCVLAANSDLGAETSMLAPHLQALAESELEQLRCCLAHWRGPVNRKCLESWVPAPQVAMHHEAPPIKDEQAPSVPLPAAAPAAPHLLSRTAPEQADRRKELQQLLSAAPAEFACTLDGGLLADPVRSPYGHVFERGSLSRALAETGGSCPVTGQPLDLEQCPRAPELRQQITKWVRQRLPAPRLRAARGVG